MTTPGGAMNIGGGGTPPDGAYSAGGTGPAAITDLNTLTEATAKERMKASAVGAWKGAQTNLFQVILSGFQSVVQAIGGALGGILDGILELVGATEKDMSAVDAARAQGEKAVLKNWSASTDQLDKIVRCGGAYSVWPYWRQEQGDNVFHVFPLTTPFPLASGTRWIPPRQAGDLASGFSSAGTNANLQWMARASGFLELTEGGLWMVFFQVAVRAFNGWGGNASGPTRSWCYITPSADPRVPIGYPQGSTVYTRNLDNYSPDPQTEQTPIDGFLYGYGRVTTFGGADSPEGGYTSFGMVPVYLESGGYKVSLSTQNDWHYGGPAATYVWAYKVNSAAMTSQIAQMKTTAEQDLQGAPVARTLASGDISAVQAKVDTVKQGEVPA